MAAIRGRLSGRFSIVRERVMLLGCCHCGEEPSDSTPPSESVESSQSDSESSVIPTIGACTERCISGIAPTRYLLTVSTTSVATCDAQYVGTFVLRISQGAVGSCGYATTQRAIRVNQSGCPEATTCTGANAPRYTLELATFASGRNLILRANAFLALFGTCVTYWTGFALQGGANVTIRNCMAGASGTATVGSVVWTWSLTPA